MREIRPVREEEAVTFLRLLCEVFGLDVGRARTIFFSEPFFDLNRKWALFDRGEIVSILTTTPMIFGWGNAIGIAGVATAPHRRGEGLASQLMEEVLLDSRRAQEGAALLFAEDPRLYQKLGFETVDRTVRVPLAAGREAGDMRTYEEVVSIYEAWCSGSPNRLRRDEQRWKYWKWNLRVCWKATNGYVCNEGDAVREAVTSLQPEAWPLLPNSYFVGLETMALAMGVDPAQGERKTHLMARDFPGQPEFFLTDQF